MCYLRYIEWKTTSTKNKTMVLNFLFQRKAKKKKNNQKVAEQVLVVTESHKRVGKPAPFL